MFEFKALVGVGLSLSMAGGCAQGRPRAEMPAVARATLVPKEFNITEYGAVGDGVADETSAVSRAIYAASINGGGTVVVPKGRFLIGPIKLLSDINLHLDKDAVLLVKNDIASFPMANYRYQDVITADAGTHDIAITGEGTIDGQGQPWWDVYRKKRPDEPADTKKLPHRPHLIVFDRCQRILISGVHLQNSPNFHFVPQDCDDLTVEDVTITAPERAPNTDALDPSGHRMFFTRLTIDVGDDNFAFKAMHRRADGSPSVQDVLITDCTMKHGHGLSIGGQTPGGMENLVVRNCTFEDTDAGIRMKANRGYGGLVRGLFYENLTMKRVKAPILITAYYPTIPADVATDPAQPVDARTPIWKDIVIKNVTITDSPEAGRILGLAEMHVENVRLENVRISAKKGMRIVNADGIHFVDSSIVAESGPATIVQNAKVEGLK
jgi:polygalacturonase